MVNSLGWIASPGLKTPEQGIQAPCWKKNVIDFLKIESLRSIYSSGPENREQSFQVSRWLHLWGANKETLFNFTNRQTELESAM